MIRQPIFFRICSKQLSNKALPLASDWIRQLFVWSAIGRRLMTTSLLQRDIFEKLNDPENQSYNLIID